MAVPIGIGCGDLIKSIQLSRNIYIKCFDEDASKPTLVEYLLAPCGVT